MKLYFAVSYLNVDAWSLDSTGGDCVACFELGTRRCLGDRVVNGQIAAHVALYFENASELHPKGDFAVDVLADGEHQVNRLTEGWYQKWRDGRIDLYRVKNMSDAAIRRAYDASVRAVNEKHQYNRCRNANALLPSLCCDASACSRGETCLSNVERALAAARGLSEPYEASAREVALALDIPPRASVGGRLPYSLLGDLKASGVIESTPYRTIRFPVTGPLPLVM